MTEIVDRLRLSSNPLVSQAALEIECLKDQITAQQTIMDRAAGILLEATVTEDGIDVAQAEVCIDSIRGKLAETGKTTAEQFMDLLYTRIGAAAGYPPGSEFNPLAVLDAMRVTMNAQQRNAERLEWAVSVLWRPAYGRRRARLIVGPRGKGGIREFTSDTSWMQAIDSVLNGRVRFSKLAQAASNGKSSNGRRQRPHGRC